MMMAMSLDDDDKQWIKGLLTEQSALFAERLHDMETNLLTEFHKWASPFEARQRDPKG
jgi:hypothetical protein